MLTVIVPMGGAGSRIGGGSPSKPFIPIGGVPMWRRTLSNLPHAEQTILFVRDDERQLIREREIGDQAIVVVSGSDCAELTDAVVKCLPHAGDGPVLIAHADQWLDWSPEHFASYSRRRGAIVLPVAMQFAGRTGFVTIDGYRGEVMDVMPKVGAEILGLCGIYWFPARAICEAALTGLGTTDQIGGRHYVECGVRRILRRGGIVDYYPVRRVWLLDTQDEVEYLERVSPWKA